MIDNIMCYCHKVDILIQKDRILLDTKWDTAVDEGTSLRHMINMYWKYHMTNNC